MSTVIDDVPSAFRGTATLPLSILDEALEEVKNQLLRRYMGSFGSALSLANGVDLYAVQVDGAKRIHTVTHTKAKPGESSRKKKSITFGHTFEELEVMQNNRHSVIIGSPDISMTTDELADLKRNADPSYMNDLAEYATTNHNKVDVVIFNDETGVQKTLQLKNTRNTGVLLEERYIFGPEAPDKIVVPSGSVAINGKTKTYYELHKDALNKIIESSKDEKRVALAKGALDKLEKGKTTRWQSLNPNIAIAKQASRDATLRVSENIAKAVMPEVAVLTVGGVIWEARDYQSAPGAMSTWERIKRFFLILWDKISESLGLRAKKELALEALNGLLAILKSTFKSFSAFIGTLGKAINQVWESLYNYLTGKITSFSELVGVILKGITTVSIGTLAFSFEQFLATFGIPSIIGGFIAAAFAGIAIVFANRGIDASIKSMVSLLSAAELAKARRAEIEAFCAEALPRIIDGADEFASLTKQYYAERSAILSKNFAVLQAGLAGGDAQRVLAALRSVNSAFGTSIPWKDIADFDALMMDESRAFKL